jgi:RNA polymerase sigma-70 factor, ECF subfamily
MAGPSMSADTDLDLLRRMAAGDEHALGALYDQWAPRVHALVLRMLGDADEAEEIVEETFWQAWRQAGRYVAERAAVSTWLMTICRSRALDRLRSRRRSREDAWSRLQGEDDASIEPPGVSAADPAADVEAADRRTQVVAALGALPTEQRAVIELAYFGGFSQSEIAERTGQPLGTIKTRTRLAMEKLRGQLTVFRDGMT